ncbi:hypothetical protein J6590_008662 [Homalodisca vitripennis]|nr:hypothetical protein J6590_008662 [Homalodisca vitripennis]
MEGQFIHVIERVNLMWLGANPSMLMLHRTSYFALSKGGEASSSSKAAMGFMEEQDTGLERNHLSIARDGSSAQHYFGTMFTKGIGTQDGTSTRNKYETGASRPKTRLLLQLRTKGLTFVGDQSMRLWDAPGQADRHTRPRDESTNERRPLDQMIDPMRTRKEPVFTRTLRQSKRIPPEKIAISITNPLALQTADSSEMMYESDDPSLPKNDEIISNRSNTNNIEIIPTSPETEESAQNKAIPTEEQEKDEPKSAEQLEEPEIELEISTELEPFEEEMEEMSDPQFVVTLNGYDPDGLFSQSGEEGDDEWLKETVDEEPLLTSTPDHMPSPKRNSSPIVFKNNPNVNHSS